MSKRSYPAWPRELVYTKSCAVMSTGVVDDRSSSDDGDI